MKYKLHFHYPSNCLSSPISLQPNNRKSRFPSPIYSVKLLFLLKRTFQNLFIIKKTIYFSGVILRCTPFITFFFSIDKHKTNKTQQKKKFIKSGQIERIRKRKRCNWVRSRRGGGKIVWWRQDCTVGRSSCSGLLDMGREKKGRSVTD